MLYKNKIKNILLIFNLLLEEKAACTLFGTMLANRKAACTFAE